mmetsp:Transcript_3688/g.10149  ORF Transcript_3688/g.10149 Transcript_3688/m.10149 type:complete len:516 (-) Transcript_3688:89-1636(-)
MSSSQSWFEATDCACNSVALNCLQMSCCMPSPAIDGPSDIYEAVSARGTNRNHNDMLDEQPSMIGGTSASWMEILANVDPDKKFRDLLIVGSHNSGSYSIAPHRAFSAIARCQNLQVLDQLEAGIRLLDLRVGGKKGSRARSDISIWHGSMEGQPFLPILQQIDQFVTDHPREIICINLVPEYGVSFTGDQKYHLLKRIHDTFEGRLVKSTEVEALLASWTLAEMAKKGKQILVFFHPRFCRNFKVGSQDWIPDELEAEFDVLNGDVWKRDPWFNTRDPGTLFQNVLRDIQTHGQKKRHQFHCSQVVLTPGLGGLADVVKSAAGTNPLRPISLSQHLYKEQCLNNFLRKNSDEQWNMFLLDFVDFCPWTVRFLTALNFPTTLEIHLGAYSDRFNNTINITDKIKKHIIHGRAVFLTNVLGDLGLKTRLGGSLTVAYRFGSNPFNVLSLPTVNKSTSMLISYYATSVDSMVSIPWSDSGLIYGGRILSSQTPVKSLRGTALRFQSTDSSCAFDVVG